jgi:hypothetical protein
MNAFLWWRSWHGAPMDPKWSVIAVRSGIKVGIVSAIAWALMDYASQHKDRGSVDGFDTETYAVYSGFDQAEIAAVIKAMTEKGIIVDGHMANWKKRQPEREDYSTPRVIKFRELKRTETQCNAETENETLDSVSVSLSLSESLSNSESKLHQDFNQSEIPEAVSQWGNKSIQQSEKLYLDITQQICTPGPNTEVALESLSNILDYYEHDGEKAAAAGKPVFAEWCNTRGKNGRNYSPTNPAWITKWLERLAPRPKIDTVDSIAQRLARDFGANR